MTQLSIASNNRQIKGIRKFSVPKSPFLSDLLGMQTCRIQSEGEKKTANQITAWAWNSDMHGDPYNKTPKIKS